MGILLNCDTRQRIYLRTEHVFGRSHMADTVLDHADASLLHASLRWTGHAWELRDHSRNGVLVDSRPLAPDTGLALTVGAIIEFCQQGRSAWIVEDLAKPTSVLWPMSEDSPVISLTRNNTLSADAGRALTIYRTADGQWFCDQDGLTRPLRDGDEVRMPGKTWCFLSGAAIQDTLELGRSPDFRIGDTLLHFHVSLDEEHVSLQIVGARNAISAGERAHHYCLLTLARRRLRDAQNGVDDNAQGWIDVEALARMLSVDISHVNIQIFRARRQVTQLLSAVEALPDIVERRRGAVRFGHWRARIVRGSALEGVFQPFATDGGEPAPIDAFA